MRKRGKRVGDCQSIGQAGLLTEACGDSTIARCHASCFGPAGLTINGQYMRFRRLQIPVGRTSLALGVLVALLWPAEAASGRFGIRSDRPATTATPGFASAHGAMAIRVAAGVRWDRSPGFARACRLVLRSANQQIAGMRNSCVLEAPCGDPALPGTAASATHTQGRDTCAHCSFLSRSHKRLASPAGFEPHVLGRVVANRPSSKDLLLGVISGIASQCAACCTPSQRELRATHSHIRYTRSRRRARRRPFGPAFGTPRHRASLKRRFRSCIVVERSR